MPDDFNDGPTPEEPSDSSIPAPDQGGEVERDTGSDASSDGSEELVDRPTYIRSQPSNYNPDVGGYFQSRDLRNLGSVDSTEPHVITRSFRHANVVERFPGSELNKMERGYLKHYVERFCSKTFMAFEAQGLRRSVLNNANLPLEEEFLAGFERIPMSRIPRDANVIGSHVLYEIKVLENCSLYCKARITPHRNHDSEKDNLKTDSAMCPLIGVRILLSTCALRRWFVTKVDIKGAFLQSGEESRDVYYKAPRKRSTKSFYWLLLVALYGLVNANAKWQLSSDSTLLSLGIAQCPFVSKLFHLNSDGELVLVVVKIVDDILIACKENDQLWFA